MRILKRLLQPVGLSISRSHALRGNACRALCAHEKSKWVINSRVALLFAVIVLFLTAVHHTDQPAYAKDMRQLNIQADKAKKALLEKATAEKKAALVEEEQSRRQILKDRNALLKAVQELEAQNIKFQSEIEAMETESVALKKQEEELSKKLAETDSVMRELVGVIRVNAKDIRTLVEHNLQTALEDNSTKFLEAIAGQSKFPGIADMEKMVDVLYDEIQNSGQVRITRGSIIDRAGNAAQAQILVVGNFTAAYRNGEETGFLNYSPAGKKLFALSRLPSKHFQKQIHHYMDGQSEAIPIDISRGAALRQLTHQLSLMEQIPKGGPIVWPILAILALGILIVLERVFFLLRRRLNADRFAERIEKLSTRKDWQECESTCKRYAGKPTARVVAAGLACRHMEREAMENALQEAILKEIPPMERFLSTLGMLAAIAPLLGLLGTVTGMIDTFHVITQHGTGDPRMMSGGISEALVTTMLGLTVAIPIMLAHTLLNRAVDKRIGQMEEKAVALINIVHKSRDADIH